MLRVSPPSSRTQRSFILANLTLILISLWLASGDSALAQPSPPLCFGVPATIIGTGGADNLTGTNGDDVIVGLGGSDKIDGRGGNDLICGGDGNDSIDGGDGNDRVDGAGGKDTISGGDGDDRIFGGPGDDSLSGNAGSDQLFGEGGADSMNGGAGSDNCFIESGGDNAGGCEANLPPNQPPTDILLSNSSVPENEPSGTSVGILSAVDPDVGDSHSFTVVAEAGTDFASFAIAGNFLDTAAVFDFETGSSYTVRIEVSDGLATFQKTFTITVTDADDPPVAAGDSATVDEDSGANSIDVLANDTDVDGGPISVASVTQPANGTVVNNGTDVGYTSDADYCNNPTGSGDTFTYTLNGGFSATVSVAVTCADDPPVAVNDPAAVPEDSDANSIDVLANDTDVDGGPISVASVTQPANGTVVNNGTDVGYTPNANYCNSPPGNTPDTFTYTLNGGSTGTVSVTVTCVDDAPGANDDSATVGEDSGATAVDVRANDTDIDGGPLNVESATDPASGTVVVSGGGLTYSPDANYCNSPPGTTPDTFSYTLNGGSTATVSVTVTCADDPPVAVNDPATVSEDLGSNVVSVLGNDTDVDGGPISVASVTQPANGTAAITGGGTGVSYAPNANYCNSPPGNSPDTFTYTLNGDSTATVSMTVTCNPDDPVVETTAGALTYTEDDPASVIDTGVTVTDFDAGATINGATITITGNFTADQDVLALSGSHPGITAAPQAGNTLTLGGTATATAYQTALQAVTYSNASQGPSTLTRTVTFTVTDDTALSGSDTKAITVAGVNDPPGAVDDTGTTDEDTSLNVAAPGVLANDTDIDPGDTKTVVALNGSGTLTGSTTEGGSVTINANGSYTYTPPAAFQALSTGESDTDSFQYTMADGAGAQSTAMVNLTVNGVSDAVTAVADSFDAIGNTGLYAGTTRPPADPGKEITGSVLDNDTDPDSPSASLVAELVTNAPTTLGGTVTIESDGNFTYHPDDVDTGVTDTFTYRVCDNSPCNAGTVANSTGTLSLVISGQVWYVRNNQAAGGDGTSDEPFDTLVEAESASQTGDTVYVFDGTNTSANLDTGYVMEANERLIGETRPLSIDPDGGGNLPIVNLFPGTPLAVPTLTATNEDVVSLASGTLVDGFNIDPSGTGGGIGGGPGAGGGAAGNVTIARVNVSDTGAAGAGPGIDLDGTTGSNGFSDITVTNGGSAGAIGVRINNAGTVNFAAAGTVTIATAGAKALDASATNMSASTFDEIIVTGSGTGAIRLNTNTGQTVLGDGAGTDLSLQTASGSTAALDVSSGGIVQVGASGSDSISATGGPAVDIRNTDGSTFDFDLVSSTASASDGINLDTNLETPFVAGGGSIGGAAGIAVDVNGGGSGGGDVSYPGAINDGSGQTAEITGRNGGTVTLGGNVGDNSDPGGGVVVNGNTGGSTTFSGTSKVLNTGAFDAVLFTSSDGHSLSFQNGNLDIDTTAGRGLEASTSGSIEVLGTANSITTGTGRALNISSTDIADNDVTFEKISSTGAANGILLNTTGNSNGRLLVTGSGGTCASALSCTGAAIQNSTGAGIELTNVPGGASLTRVAVTGGGDDGIRATTVHDVDLVDSVVLNNGNFHGGGAEERGLDYLNVTATPRIVRTTVSGSDDSNAHIRNTTSTAATLTVDQSTFSGSKFNAACACAAKGRRS